jgi:hypothetical protein
MADGEFPDMGNPLQRVLCISHNVVVQPPATARAIENHPVYLFQGNVTNV